MEFLQLVTDHGFPVAAAIICGYFIFLIIKFILRDVYKSIKELSFLISSLNNRVKIMCNDLVHIDIHVSKLIGLKIDLDKIARIDTDDVRKD